MKRLFRRLRGWLRRECERVRTVRRLASMASKYGEAEVLWIVDCVAGQYGHAESRTLGVPVDAAGAPLPWYTYGAIEYLEGLDFSQKSIFEYGSGQSSRYWAKRSRRLVSVESDPAWYKVGLAHLAQNQELILETEKEKYVGSSVRRNEAFDVVVIDGGWRRECAEVIQSTLAEDGVIILDNSDWWPTTSETLREMGFLQVDFAGMGPVNPYCWTTSMFFSRKAAPIPRTDRQPAVPIGGLRQVAE